MGYTTSNSLIKDVICILLSRIHIPSRAYIAYPFIMIIGGYMITGENLFSSVIGSIGVYLGVYSVVIRSMHYFDIEKPFHTNHK